MNTDTIFIIADNQDITQAGMYQFITHLFGKGKIRNVAYKRELLSALIEYSESVVILDYTLFDLNGVEDFLVIEKRFPFTRWIIFSNELSESAIRQLSAEKSVSLLLKDCSKEEIETALMHAARKERYICQQIATLLLVEANKQDRPSPLTTSEIEILKLVAHGKSVKEIASIRSSSIHTIITHKKNIFRKLGVNNVYEATRYAVRAGFVDLVEYYI